MSDVVKVALIAAATVIVVVCLWIYFSPYQSCVRAATKLATGTYQDPASAARYRCARYSN